MPSRSRAVLEEALRVVGQSDLERKEVYVFSDLTRAAWPSEPAPALAERIAEQPDVGAYLIDVGVPQPVNFALGDLRLGSEVLTNRSPLVVNAEIDCQGPGTAHRRTLPFSSRTRRTKRSRVANRSEREPRSSRLCPARRNRSHSDWMRR